MIHKNAKWPLIILKQGKGMVFFVRPPSAIDIGQPAMGINQQVY